MSSSTFGKAAASLAVIAMAATPVAAKKAGSLRDLVGISGASAESELQRRGFEYKSGDKSGTVSTTWWWHRGDKDCVAVAVSNGRVAGIDDAKAADCGEKGGGGSGAAIAAGAIGALAIGAILLSKKDKDKHREQYQQDWQPVEAYNTQSGRLRIFRNPSKDARVQQEVSEGTRLRNFGCDQYNGESWCEVTTMNGRTTGWARDRYLRPVDQGYPGGGGGWGSGGGGGWGGGGSYPAEFADLDGTRVPGAEAALRDRGFRNVDGFSSGSTRYTIWYRSGSRQCVQMGAANGRVANIVDIRTHPSCR
ncbi:hypothetical protein ACLBKU_04490 [Erythrobacter sp. NE805]|uniref:hypothetical protein n=1 Tax=Erythrobacter sp. NE805 TaxID=3389875 RepID=UPI00396B2315